MVKISSNKGPKLSVTEGEAPEWHEDASVLPMVKMWRSVIGQSVIDAVSKSRKSRSTLHRRRGAQWICEGGEDFDTVCHMGGMDPAYVREKILQARPAIRELARELKERRRSIREMEGVAR